MKILNINQFDEKEEEITDTLISLGMSRPAARTLACLSKVNEATSIDLEMGTNLRQPEVSIAAKQLRERAWIQEREEKRPSKGRPLKIYSLKVGFKDIIMHLEKQQKKAVDDEMKSIKLLKELSQR